MPKCKDCEADVGLINIKGGLCPRCRPAICQTCGIEAKASQLSGGVCDECSKTATSKEVDGRNSSTQAAESRPETINIAIATLNEIPQRSVAKYLGLARGGTVRAKHIGRDFTAGIKNLVGGEIKGYTELMAEAREEAVHRMKQDALRLGADAVVGMNFSTSMIDAGVAEVYAFGTAVRLQPDRTEE